MTYRVLDIERAKAVLSYIINRIEQPTLLKIFKVLYFAEQKHLVTYGQPMLDDHFVAMEKGPVPFLLYQLFQDLKNKAPMDTYAQPFYRAFAYSDRLVSTIEPTDMDYLSESNMECLDESIRENNHLTDDQLSEKSHDAAWKNADEDEVISLYSIARAGGAGEGMIEHIQENEEAKSLFREWNGQFR